MSNRGPKAPTAILVVVTIGLLVVPGVVTAASAGPARASHSAVRGLAVASVGDDEAVYANSSESGPLVDLVLPGLVGAAVRTYTIEVRVETPNASALVNLTTDPVEDWSSPSQLPGGPDALPGLSAWNWSVTRAGHSDTMNWTGNSSSDLLARTVAWQNATFLVRGVFDQRESVAVLPFVPDGTTPTTIGYSLNGWVPPMRAEVSSPVGPAAAALHASVVRFGVTSTGTLVGWNNATQTPVLNFSRFDAVVQFIESVGASAMVSLPAGSWGNGNSLPGGMPLDLSMPLEQYGAFGYFPIPSAFATLVGAIATHVRASGEAIPYWEVGNEVPLINDTEVAVFSDLISVAANAIHAALPSALVSADDMTDKHYIAEFAADAEGVGFLSFHFYPTTELCLANGSYCAPGTDGNGTTDSELLGGGSNISEAVLFLPPRAAQAEWFNITGHELPDLDTESNMNTAGGGANTTAIGTDPRIQTLFGGAWLGSTLIDASNANVSSFVYFRITNPPANQSTATLPYGGFGFGMTSLWANDTLTEYAPYWAAELWSSGVPLGSHGVVTNDTGSSDVASYGVRLGHNVSVVLVNRMATAINVSVGFPNASDWHGTNLTVLDNRSYDETFNASGEDPTVVRSGLLALPAPPEGQPIALGGYGMAVLAGSYLVPAGNKTGNATGNESGNSTNATGNSTSHDPSSGGNVTQNQTGPVGGNVTNGTLTSTPPTPPGHASRTAGTSPLSGVSPTGGLSATGLAQAAADRWTGLGVLVLGLAVVGGAWKASAPLPRVPRPRTAPSRSAPARAPAARPAARPTARPKPGAGRAASGRTRSL
jgi:hypothetical protein